MGAPVVGLARPVVLRGHGAALVPAAVWVGCALGMLDAVVEGSSGYALRTMLLMTAIAFGAWWVLASPCLEVSPQGLRVVNPLRVHEIPFAALDAVQVRGLTTIVARERSGRLRSVTSWNAPGAPRRPDPGSMGVAEIIERYRVAWERAHRGNAHEWAFVRWRSRPALVMGALVGANIAIWLR